MRGVWLGLLLVLPAAAPAAGAGAPLSWSPDGRWLAYTVAGPAARPVPPPGWLTGASAPAPADPEPAALRRYRIYVADATTGDTILLEESGGGLTSPAWGPDGRTVAFGRVVTPADGPPRFEVVIQDGLDRKRVVTSRPIPPGAGFEGGGASQAPAWSPDGRFLAVPAPGDGLLVVRADTGLVLRSVEDAAWPAWSPDGSRLAFVRPGESAELAVMETGFGRPRVLAELGRTYQGPTWARDGRSLLALATRTTMSVRRPGPRRLAEAVRVQVDTGQVETVTPLATLDEMIHAGAAPGSPPVRGVSMSVDRDQEQLVSSIDAEGQPASVLWMRLQNLEPVARFHPIGEISVRVGALALSPGGRALAVRLGPDDAGGTLALWDAEARTTRLVGSDDDTRLEWVALLVGAAEGLLRTTLPAAAVGGKPVARPTVLPVPGELPASQEVVLRLRRIGRYGRPLCDRPSGSKDDPRLDAYLEEARLFFEVLQEDYVAAMGTLDGIEARTEDPDGLARLLAVRAQLLLGQGDLERAGDVIAYLRSLDARAPVRYEETPAGVSLTPEPSPSSGWPGYLAERLDAVARARAKSTGGGEPAAAPREIERPGGLPGFGLPFGNDPGGLVFPPPRAAVRFPEPPADDEGVRVRFRRRMRPAFPR